LKHDTLCTAFYNRAGVWCS